MDYNITLPVTSHVYVHYSGCALLRPTCADTVIRIMDKQRRCRYSSLGTTLGRGDYSGDMGQDYTEEMVMEASRGPSRNGWSLIKEGPPLIVKRQNSSTPIVSPDVFNERGQVVTELDTPFLECGFYWYKNTSLHQNKSSALTEHESVRGKLVALCSDEGGQLSELCNSVLGNTSNTEIL